MSEPESDDPEHPFAPYVRILGRGPGRSRALTRDEDPTSTPGNVGS